MTEILLKFQAHLYRPDGSKVGTVRAVFDEDHGPCIVWKCVEDKETIERIEIVLGGKGIGGRNLNMSFEKDDTLIVPLEL